MVSVSQSIRDRYKLLRGIGTTPAGRIFEAVDVATGLPVEVQVWNAADGNDEEIRQFCAVAERLATLEHPNIVRVLDAVTDHSACFLVTEPAPRETLAAMMEQGSIDLERLKSVTVDALRGLEGAHEHGVAHGRLRASAIVVSDDGRAKVRDFGLHRLLRLEDSALGAFAVDRLYLPPGRTESLPDDPQSDLYSLGVVLYQALAGISPASLDDAPAVVALERFIRDGIPVSMLSEGVPPDWDDLISRSVAEDRSQRFSAAGNMRRCVEALSESRLAAAPSVFPDVVAADSGADIIPFRLDRLEDDDRPADAETLSLAPFAAQEETAEEAYAPILWEELPVFEPAAGAEDLSWTSQGHGWEPNSPPEEKRRLRGRAGYSPPWGLVAAVAVCLILGSAAAAALAHMRRPSAPRVATSHLVALNVPGDGGHRVYASGAEVSVRWPANIDANLYRLQIAYGGTGSSTDSAAAHMHLVTADVHSASYRFWVVGARDYRWRVAARYGTTWSPFSRWNTFAVRQPVIARPVPLAPVTGALVHAARTRLCWSAVSGASGYVTRLSPGKISRVTSTCASVRVHRGSYTWSVAAEVKAAQLYRGPWSKVARFTVPASGRHHAVTHGQKHAAAPPAPSLVPTPTPVPAANPPVVAQPVVPVQPAPTAFVAAPLPAAPAPAAPSAPQVQAPAPSTNPAPATNPSTGQGTTNQNGNGSNSGGCIAFVNC